MSEIEIRTMWTDLRYYEGYKSLLGLKLKQLEEIKAQIKDLGFPKGILYDSIPSTNGTDVGQRIVELVGKQWVIENDIEFFSRGVKRVETFISRLDGTDKSIIEDWFFVRRCVGWKDFCRGFNYSNRGMRRKIDQIIKENI